MPNGVLVVYSRCKDPDREDEFNRWYDEIHVPDVLSVPHFVSAQRFKLSGPPNKNEPGARYAAIYGLDTDDTRAAMKELGVAMGRLTQAGRISELLEATSATTWAAIGERQDAT